MISLFRLSWKVISSGHLMRGMRRTETSSVGSGQTLTLQVSHFFFYYIKHVVTVLLITRASKVQRRLTNLHASRLLNYNNINKCHKTSLPQWHNKLCPYFKCIWKAISFWFCTLEEQCANKIVLINFTDIDQYRHHITSPITVQLLCPSHYNQSIKLQLN